jgi:hypothetical protein
MSFWFHLPNAKHIERVVSHAKTYPEVWKYTLELAQINCATLGYNLRQVAFELATEKVRSIEGRRKSVDHIWDKDHKNSFGVLLALIAYDDAGKYLDLSSEKLKMIIGLSEHPAAILLLHAVLAFEEAKKG